MSVKVIYQGARSGGAEGGLLYEDNHYNIGDEVSLSAAERDRLSNYLNLADAKDGEPIAPDPTAAPQPPVAALTTESGGSVSVDDGGSSGSKASADSTKN
jgi:hypothetical protein